MTKLSKLAVREIASSDLSELDTSQLRESMNSPFTLVVPGYASVVSALRDATKARANVVVAVSDDGEPVGVFVPEQFRGKLLLGKALSSAGVEEIDARMVEFFRNSRPILFWCEKHKHHTPTLPCPF